MRARDKNKEIAVIESAIKLTNRLGFVGVSIAKIAKEAGVSPATIYIYFENKEDMINKLYVSLKQEMSEFYFKNFDLDLSTEEGFKLLWYNLYNYILQNPEHFSFVEQYANSPLVPDLIKEKGKSFFAVLEKFYQKGQKQGIIRNSSIYLLNIFSFYPLFQLMKIHVNDGFELNDFIVDETFNMTWNSIKS